MANELLISDDGVLLTSERKCMIITMRSCPPSLRFPPLLPLPLEVGTLNQARGSGGAL